jgi:phosphoglycolate phosphatase/AHBA synthesis associated protein
VRAVLFDLDGVLVDSFEVWWAVVNDARVRFGFPPITREELAPIFGQGLGDDMKNLYPGRTRAEIVAAYDDAMPRSIGRMTLNPQARTALEGLRVRGLKRAVVTNTQASLAGVVLRTVGLTEHVDACVAVAPPLREKPAPDLILEALAQLCLRPAEALMVGDTDYDRQAAEAAGTPFLRYELRKGTSLTTALGGLLGG